MVIGTYNNEIVRIIKDFIVGLKELSRQGEEVTEIFRKKYLLSFSVFKVSMSF